MSRSGGFQETLIEFELKQVASQSFFVFVVIIIQYNTEYNATRILSLCWKIKCVFWKNNSQASNLATWRRGPRGNIIYAPCTLSSRASKSTVLLNWKTIQSRFYPLGLNPGEVSNYVMFLETSLQSQQSRQTLNYVQKRVYFYHKSHKS